MMLAVAPDKCPMFAPLDEYTNAMAYFGRLQERPVMLFQVSFFSQGGPNIGPILRPAFVLEKRLKRPACGCCSWGGGSTVDPHARCAPVIACEERLRPPATAEETLSAVSGARRWRLTTSGHSRPVCGAQQLWTG